jgi:hypothetical protein
VPPSHFSHGSPTDTESQPSSEERCPQCRGVNGGHKMDCSERWIDQHDETVKQTGVDPASITADIAAIRAGIERLA